MNVFIRLVFGILVVGSVGCLDFGPSISTTSPSTQQVRYCRQVMSINPNVKIKPIGYKEVNGIDKAIWFKFIADTDDVAEVFLAPPIDSLEFQAGFKSHYELEESWWDPGTKSLIGGRFNVPVACGQSIAIHDNQDGTLTIYVMWHET